MRAVAVAVLLAPLVFFTAFVGGFGVATTATQSATSPGATASPGPGPTSFTIATFNILGASHTDGEPGHGLGGGENEGWPSWRIRLPGAMKKLAHAGVSIAGLQEVHAPQSRALATTYREAWGMYPRDPRIADKVIWDRTRWSLTDQRLVRLPYFYGQMVGTPLVQLTDVATGQVMWVWSVHNPIGARRHRVDALRRELRETSELAATGVPVILVGDFNDGSDGHFDSRSILTPSLIPAPAGASIDHLYGAHLAWLSIRTDGTPKAERISDHPLVSATWRPGG